MEPEGSLLHSQVPATCLYPEPNRSRPYPHILLPEDPSYYMCHPHESENLGILPTYRVGVFRALFTTNSDYFPKQS